MWKNIFGKSDQHALPAYGMSYFNNVRAEFAAIPKEDLGKIPTGLRETAQVILDKGQHISWADVFALEITVAKMQSGERMKHRICILREKYRVLVGDAVYQHYLDCSATDIQKASVEELRSEIETLLSEFHWVYSSSKTRETLFGNLRTKLIVPILAYGTFVIAFAWSQLLFDHGNIPTLAMVILAGVVGSFTSVMRRLQLAQTQPASSLDDPIIEFAQLGMGETSVLLALISGGVFATVLYLMFIGKFLEGALFPAIYTPAGASGLSFFDFAMNTDPIGGVNYAKLLVWSFISGFAERFVPDVLDRFVAKGLQVAGQAGTPTQPPATPTPPKPVVPPAQPTPPALPAANGRTMNAAAESHLDGCDIPIVTATPDEDLPPSRGGVA